MCLKLLTHTKYKSIDGYFLYDVSDILYIYILHLVI